MTTIKHHVTFTNTRRLDPSLIDTGVAFHTQTVSSPHRITRCHNSNTADDNYHPLIRLQAEGLRARVLISTGV